MRMWSFCSIQRRCAPRPTVSQAALATGNQHIEPEVMCHVRVTELWCSCMWFSSMWKVSQFVSATETPHSIQVLSFLPESSWMTIDHTHELGRMQDPLSAAVRDQLNENEPAFRPDSEWKLGTEREETPSLWPVSPTAEGTNDRASMTRLLPPGRGTIG